MVEQSKKLLLSLFLWGIYLPVFAQQYGYVQYNGDTGAPFEQVSSVIQDEAGFVWIGSENGLYRFDGVHFDLYSLHTQSQNIHQLHAEGENLFFANDLSIYQIGNTAADPEVSPVLEGSINETDSLPFYPNDFLIGRNQEVWISQSNHSIGLLRGKTFSNYRFSDADRAQKLALQEGPDGGIWALSPVDGLFYFDTDANVFQKKLASKGGTSLLIHKDRLLIGKEELSIYRIRGKRLILEKMVAIENGLITAIHVDQEGQYLIGTQKGKLMRLPDLNSPPQPIYGGNEAHRVEELDFGHIYEIYVSSDSTNNNDRLWVCSETGLWLLQQRFFKTVKNLPMNNPIGIAIGNDSKVWVPLNNLYEITPKADDFVAQAMYNNMQVNAVAKDGDGFTWVSRNTPSVELLKYKDDKLIRRYDFHDRGEAIFNLYPDHEGNLWFCQAPLSKPIVGVAKINAKGGIDYYAEDKGFSSRVLTIKESARGEIYAAGIGEKSYLYRYDRERDQFVNLSPKLPFEALLNFEVHDLTIDDRGIVWLATTDGLLRYDSEQITLIKNDLLGQEEVRGVTHYANNNIWVATATKGLVFHQQTTSTVLGEQEGLPAVISAYRCINTDAEGRLWAGTSEGLVYSRMSAASLPYSNSPRLRKISSQGEEFTSGFDSTIQLRQDQALQLVFTNLSFPAKNVQYQYRLLPVADKQIMLEEQLWQANGKSNSLQLSELELGDYFLDIRARQTGGFQWSKPLNLKLYVYLPWYLRSWFIYGSLGSLFLLVGYYFRFYVKQRFKRLQQVLKYSNEKLANKESQLLQKIKEFEIQQEELDNANSNIQILELFIKGIPKKASWDDVISAMGKAVMQAVDIDAFEIAFKEEGEIVHRGYSNMERSRYTFRSKTFDAKTSLTCWTMVNKREVMINDFNKEHTLYIDEKDAYHFKSLIFIPFKLENEQAVVLCAYSVKAHDFDHNDLVMFRILAKFIHFSIHQELKKQS
ncbi:MAG: hypothetical protein KTR30_18440 [Saprospiraceae bacterium]|nr:hypothetical protein [Saprospiraceae bacterium]